jgi:hypothetical protein
MARVFLYIELTKLSSRSKMITKTIDASKIAIFDRVTFQYKNDLKGYYNFESKLYEVYAYCTKFNNNILIGIYNPIVNKWVVKELSVMNVYSKQCIKYRNILIDAINTPRQIRTDR